MLFASGMLFVNGAVGFDGVLIPVIALMSSFGPVVALAALGSTLQNTFAAGNRVLDILEEKPVVEEVSGKQNIEFNGASSENVTFAYGDETILDNVSVDIPKNSVIRNCRTKRKRKIDIFRSSLCVSGMWITEALIFPGKILMM